MFSSVDTVKSDNFYTDMLVDTIQSWAAEMKIPSLRDGSVSANDFDRIIAVTENKNNPTHLTKDEMREALEMESAVRKL